MVDIDIKSYYENQVNPDTGLSESVLTILVDYDRKKEWYCKLKTDELTKDFLGIALKVLSDTILNDKEVE